MSMDPVGLDLQHPLDDAVQFQIRGSPCTGDALGQIFAQATNGELFVHVLRAQNVDHGVQDIHGLLGDVATTGLATVDLLSRYNGGTSRLLGGLL